MNLAEFAQIAMLLLFPLFSLNRYFAVIHPIKYVTFAINRTLIVFISSMLIVCRFSIHMTTKRVHIYCNAIIAFMLIGFIFDIFAVSFYFNSYYYLFSIATFAELLITPTTSIWVCCFCPIRLHFLLVR